jgi:hypothetical protein
LGILVGSVISLMLAGIKVMHPHQSVMEVHGPMFVIGSVLVVAGIQMLAIGLLGELQVRHYFSSKHPVPYAIERMVRLRTPQEQDFTERR